ncbi:cell filamentation protein Fic [Ectothiorhodospiraceae bacterium BW-2]|nr:cell filamentation protein Fic [Ectothiorhodospiraceae bacterium BW-2]
MLRQFDSLGDHHWHIQPNRGRALMLAKRQLAELVCDAVNLEGLPFTLPEIQTLLDGVTVGGHRLSDQQIALNQANAWRELFALLEQDVFSVTIDSVCALHCIAAKQEALQWGTFRTGSVTIAGSDYLPPKAAELPRLFEQMVAQQSQFNDIYDYAIHLFLTMARYQFFYDVNKRMGRLVMNGVLLNQGYPAINLPAKRQLEFNQLMLDFYHSGEQREMNRFMRSCLDPRVIAIMQE